MCLALLSTGEVGGREGGGGRGEGRDRERVLGVEKVNTLA